MNRPCRRFAPGIDLLWDEIFYAFRSGDLTTSQIAELTGYDKSTVQGRLREARSRLEENDLRGVDTEIDNVRLRPPARLGSRPRPVVTEEQILVEERILAGFRDLIQTVKRGRRETRKPS